MPRYRLIPTDVPITSDLKTTLSEMGLKNVEVHAAPAPLDDWIGRPTDVMANVIVRRKDLGASSDDMGFVRNPDGTWDALVSEIHLFRFDKKWFQELAERSGVSVPTEGPRQFAASSSSPVMATPVTSAAAVKAAAAARAESQAQFARLAAAEALEKAKQSQGMGAWGCVLFFVPLILTAIAGAMGARISLPVVLGAWTAWAFVWFCVVIVVYSLRFQARVREFVKRFPKGGEGHAAAVAHLKSVAADKQSQAAGVAARLLRQVEQTPASLKPHPKSPRERGG